MRQVKHHQLSFPLPESTHKLGRELQRVGELLDDLGSDALRPLQLDLAAGSRLDRGRTGLTAEQVLRCIVYKQTNGLSYERLAFALVDSVAARKFCRLDLWQTPSKGTLQRNCKRISPENLAQINEALVRMAVANRWERVYRVRADSTTIESNIHDPTDSSLLADCVRVLVRIMRNALEYANFSFTDCTRAAKRRLLEIMNAGCMDKRKPLYKKLCKTTEATVEGAERAAAALDDCGIGGVRAYVLAAELRHYIGLAYKVIRQTRRRVLEGESVPVDDKIVSIFEPHTDIIVKGRRDVIYGHKVFLSTGASGLILTYDVSKGNPSDCSRAADIVSRIKDVCGVTPNQAVFDGGFASKDNLEALKELGVKNPVFHKTCGLDASDMVSSTRMFRRLRNFRAGVEAGISFLKRCFGWARCNWSSLRSFTAYAGASVLAANLLTLARLKP